MGLEHGQYIRPGFHADPRMGMVPLQENASEETPGRRHLALGQTDEWTVICLEFGTGDREPIAKTLWQGFSSLTCSDNAVEQVRQASVGMNCGGRDGDQPGVALQD